MAFHRLVLQLPPTRERAHLRPLPPSSCNEFPDATIGISYDRCRPARFTADGEPLVTWTASAASNRGHLNLLMPRHLQLSATRHAPRVATRAHAASIEHQERRGLLA